MELKSISGQAASDDTGNGLVKNQKCSFEVLSHEKRSDNNDVNKKTYSKKKKDSYKTDGLNQLNIKKVKVREIENNGDYLHLGLDIF